MAIRLYNTMGRKYEDFQSIEPMHVGMYTCGPTVYNYAHVGNLRTYVFEDVLKRMLEHFGYSVKHVMNITDVGHLTGDGDDGEDKLGKMARETGRSAWDIAAFYTEAFFKDYDSLNIIRPDVVCPATKHIPEMIALIQRLEKGGHTYVSGGNVYFSIDTFPDYGKLAGLDLEKLQSGARIDVDSNKRNPKDFVLWFTNSKFGKQEMMWDSPWGVGYPGWHIECSAMSMKYLGEQFDIHCGGIDAIPVHHTNEIAQSEAATGKVPWVRYWLHGEFLLSDKGGKMSKSSGEFLTMPLLVSKGYDPLDYRLFCLGAHYRSQLQFTYQALDSAKASRRTLLEKTAQIRSQCKAVPAAASDSSLCRQLADFDDDISNDMNMPKALADMWSLVKDDSLSPEVKYAGLLYMDKVLGLELDKAVSADDDIEIPPEALILLEKRTAAKKARDWAAADQARSELDKLGFAVKDTLQGARLIKKM
ncbi:MAG: cysteine--tRNA ligase [Sphaerochaetaceae bacterium]|jgi:cysteinyl-tRNA synthetase|nr:cysteine--tRNA ligase [Sphaerochaetaceae bacterium]MDD3162750.1 cysteine--tRNA ligase [Sphaerochaetaceae bacterium]MDD4006970.1 cysteine--tRNA ligase [Sphaerochaetaceae bacterium]MDD4396065.1 cysteine--tRNA ligase [Sphaerochaetaceae bacterium]